MAKKKPSPEPAPPEGKPKLRLEWRSPSELAENPANWRRHPEAQLSALTDTLAEVGWAGALLFNERTGRLIDGHGRRKVALSQGSESVPVLVGDWSEEDERKILATLDPLAAMAEADDAALTALLASISTQSEAINAMFADMAPAPELPTPGGGGDEFDATPATAGETRTKVGDVWEIGPHRLLVGDCTDPANVAILMGGEKPHLMVTDPPYGVEYDATWRKDAMPETNPGKTGGMYGKVANDGRADWREAWALFPGDVAYVWHAGINAGAVQDSLVASDFAIRSQIVWVKNNFAIGRGDYHWKHEPCWYAVRNGKTAHYNGDRTQSTVWEIDKPHNSETGHSTQKPIECMSKPIENNSLSGETVYDPFLGSGTTLIAAHRLGRVCYGCEIEPRYGDVILKRAEAEGLTVRRLGD